MRDQSAKSVLSHVHADDGCGPMTTGVMTIFSRTICTVVQKEEYSMRIEQHIAIAWAERLTKKVLDDVIDILTHTNAELSGDSGLKNVWEEVCAQVQSQESAYWSAYDWTLSDLIERTVGNLGHDEQLALWSITDAGWDYIHDHHTDRDGVKNVPVDTGDIVQKLRGVLLSAADDYESPTLYRFLWGEDDPQYGDEEEEELDREKEQ
jgi:hypothetical protein